jgi:hypothetical protein
VLTPVLDEPVNLVNAPVLAEQLEATAGAVGEGGGAVASVPVA